MLFYMVTGAPKTTVRKNLKIDESLFHKIGEGDNEALESLYNTSERTIYAYVLSILKNPQDTLDVVQETYLKVRGAAHLYKPMGKPLAWMFTIARNLSMDFVRRQSKEPAKDYQDFQDNKDFSYIEDPIDNMILQSALNILAEDERQIVILFAVSGLKHREIAESLDIPLSSELSRYHRAIKKLKDHLEEEEGF